MATTQARLDRRFRYSPHAVSRMTTLRVTASEVEAVLATPSRREPGGRGHDPHNLVYVGRRIRVVYKPRARVVVTVTLNTAGEIYTHGVHTVDDRPHRLIA